MKFFSAVLLVLLSYSSAFASTVKPWVYQTPKGFESMTVDADRIFAATTVDDNRAELAFVVNKKTKKWSWAFILYYRSSNSKITKYIDVHARNKKNIETKFPATGGINLSNPTDSLSVVTVYVAYDSVIALKGKDTLAFRYEYNNNDDGKSPAVFRFSVENYETALTRMEDTLRKHNFKAALVTRQDIVRQAATKVTSKQEFRKISRMTGVPISTLKMMTAGEVKRMIAKARAVTPKPKQQAAVQLKPKTTDKQLQQHLYDTSLCQGWYEANKPPGWKKIVGQLRGYETDLRLRKGWVGPSYNKLMEQGRTKGRNFKSEFNSDFQTKLRKFCPVRAAYVKNEQARKQRALDAWIEMKKQECVAKKRWPCSVNMSVEEYKERMKRK